MINKLNPYEIQQYVNKMIGQMENVGKKAPQIIKNTANTTKNVATKVAPQFGKRGGLPMAMLIDAVVRNPLDVGPGKGTMLNQIGWNMMDSLFNPNKQNNKQQQKQQPKIDLSKGNGQAWTNNDFGTGYEYQDDPEFLDYIGKVMGHYESPADRQNKFLWVEGDTNVPTQQQSNQITQPQQSNQQSSQQQSQNQDISDVLKQYKQYLQEANGPQIEAIQNFLNTYPKLYDDYNRQKRFWNAFSAYSGEPIYRENAIDPREQELARIQLINQLQQLKTGNLDKLNAIRGNIAIANALGLDDETALADKNMLDLYGKLKQYESMLEGKEYTADKNLEGKKYSSNMGYMGKTYSADRGYDTAIDKQKLYNNMRMNTSILGGIGNISSYGMDPSQFIEIANQLSKYGLKITPQEQAGLNQSGTGLSNQQQQAINRFNL